MSPTPQQLADMFDRTARRYDALNAILSLGRDAVWRRAAAAPIRPGSRVLDLCCGSARSAVAAYRRSGADVIGADVSVELLNRGRAYAESEQALFCPVRADAFRLPFENECFDAVLVAWGLRNLTPNDRALAEVRRVLRPDGMLHVLDSPAPSGWSAPLHRFYLRVAVPLVGLLSSDPPAYRYLASSIEAFGTADEVAGRIARAGFQLEAKTPLMLGAAVIWRGRKTAESASAIRGAPADSVVQNPSPAVPSVQFALGKAGLQ